MSKFYKSWLFWAILGIIVTIIVTIIVGYPSWKEYFYDSGPIYSSQSDQKLKTVLDDSGITRNLPNYKFYILKPASDLKIDANEYSGSGSYKFSKSFKRKMYVSLLEDILSRNEDQIEYYINKEDKIIFIWSKNQVEKF